MIQTIFLEQHTTLHKPLSKKEKVNIILSPIFYWAKIFTIPIDSSKKALPLLANLFEDYFDTDGYSFYTVQLEENKYLAFAYDEFKIIHFLKKVKIPLKNIENIYLMDRILWLSPNIPMYSRNSYWNGFFFLLNKSESVLR